MIQRPSKGQQIETPDYLAEIFQPSDQLALLVRNRHRGETVQRIAGAARVLERSFQEWLHSKNGRDGFDVYVGMNPLKPGARSRTKEDIFTIRNLYVDLDHQGPTALDAIQRSNLVPQPNYVLSTSRDKFQVVWQVDGISRDGAEALLRGMAHKFGADSAATDSTRVLRLPGFFNHKYEEKVLVRAEKYSDRINHLLDFKLRTDSSDSPYQTLRRSSARTLSSQTRTLSQSEHDWSLAKRPPARETDPEETIRSTTQDRTSESAEIVDTPEELP